MLNEYTKKGEFMKKWIIIVSTIVLVCIISGWLGYHYWITSPLYSIQQVGIALKEGNNTKLEKYMNLDGLLDKTFSQMLMNEMRQSGEEDNLFAIGMVMMMKSQLVNLAKHSILSEVREIAKTNVDGKSKKQFVKSVKVVEKEKDLASVEVIFNGANGNKIRFLLAMRKKGDYWQVEEILNPEENFGLWYQKAKAQ